MAIEFPKPLPPLITHTILDDNGISGCEIVSLQNAWRVIKPNMHQHASDIFLDFFTENEMHIEKYRISNGKIDIELLHHHAFAVLRIYERIIEDGLNELTMNAILAEVAERHRRCGVVRKDVAMLTKAVQQHLLDALRKISSPTLVMALTKLQQVIMDVHDNGSSIDSGSTS